MAVPVAAPSIVGETVTGEGWADDDDDDGGGQHMSALAVEARLPEGGA